ncbi:glycosyltransferase family 4 protein [Salinivibrio sp. AR640]|uniref:glycosyltransferase family 4 protein n=1 Tax=Salinivibrio sp. AR640 TaxID=1909437 RepID=UPI0009874726|nr:glycosyltransferase family 4 protein [Salinivibrio sp. AR640]OOE87963.1 glycosyltransferase WbuB [Salinivibrio sp. AR640]
MNILYFHQHFSTPKGSTGIRSYEMARRLIHYGHHVTMVCGTYGGGETGLDSAFIAGKREGIIDGIRIIEFDLAYSNSDGFFKRSMTFVNFALKSICLAFTEKYDVLFATTTPLTAGIPGIFARWLRGKPFVFEVRDLWPELPKEMGVINNPIILGLMSFLEWASYRSAHRCIGLSPGIVEGIKKRGVDESKIAMVPNGCDLVIFSQPSEPWRPEGVKETDLMAIFTGTHGVANGLDAVLNTAVELQKRGRKDIKLALVGQGKLKPELEKRAKELGLNNVVFHSPVNKQKLSGLMASADVGIQVLANISAFYYGTSPNKFFDYISAGLPVINNYPGWLAGMIEQTQCGFAVQPDDPSAFADALEKAANQRDALTLMGANARQLAESQFDRALLADKWVDWVTGTSAIDGNAADSYASKATSSEVDNEKTL